MIDFDTSPQDKRKSFALALFIYAILLVILFFIRFWPPAGYEKALLAGGGGGGGMEINFGDSDVGKGDNYKSEVLDVKDNVKSNPATAQPDEEIISEDTDEPNTTVIPKHTTPKNPVKPVVKDIKQPAPEKPKVKQSTNDALSNILNGSNKGGDGNDRTGGNKGSANGNINSSGYYGSGGSGGGTGGGNGTGNGTGTGAGSGSGSGGGHGSGNGLGSGAGYSLAGRKALVKPIPDGCKNEYGTVVVKVIVDKNGNVISASPGYRGTTNSDSCLMNQARNAAMSTKWSANENAADKQEGTIRYNFSP